MSKIIKLESFQLKLTDDCKGKANSIESELTYSRIYPQHAWGKSTRECLENHLETLADYRDDLDNSLAMLRAKLMDLPGDLT